MRSVITRLILLTLLTTPALAEPAVLTIATFNAEFLTKPKVHVRFDLPFRSSQWSDEQRTLWTPEYRDQKFAEAIDKVAPVIAGIGADVVVLTEVGDEQDVGELTAALSALGVEYPHVQVCDCKDRTTSQHVAVLSKLALFNPVPLVPGREGFFAEDDDADSEDETGLSKSIKVQFAFQGRQFHLYGLHLKSERGYSEADNQRIAQASLVRRHYLPLLQKGEHVIVAGDLNDGRGQPALKRIRGFDDIGPDLVQTGHIGFFELTEYAERWTHSYLGTRSQVDHILVSRSIKDAARIKARVVSLPDPTISDHRPFVVQMRFRQ